MELHKVAHKLFLTAMVAVCALAVILFLNQSTNAFYGQMIEGAPVIKETSTTMVAANDSILSENENAAIDATGTILSGQPGNYSAGTKTTTVVSESTPLNQETKDGVVEKDEENEKTGVVDKGNIVDKAPLASGSEGAKGIQSQEISSEINKTDDTKDGIASEEVIETVKDTDETKADLEGTKIGVPMFIKESDLAKEKNPKLFGTVDQKLLIESVDLVNEDNEASLLIKGKAFPNSIVSIYIFSDPIVITVNSDANGNWSYDLSKGVEDGKHEAYVVVTDNSGKVMLKSQPVAFVKTAQAATMIPYSELNKSPIEKTTEKYILIAISIMAACLVIAIAMIGILTHKQKMDETTF